MKPTNRKPSWLGLVLVAFFLSGCIGHQLAPGGVYQGDKVLYTQDIGIITAYDMIHAFVKWEYTNRDILMSAPDIKKYADKCRREAPVWIATAIAARDAYAAFPNDGNAIKYKDALRILHNAVIQIGKYMVEQSAKGTA